MEIEALTKSARRLLAHAQLHKAIAAEHQVMAKAFGNLANRCSDKNISECAAIAYAIKSAVSYEPPPPVSLRWHMLDIAPGQ